VCVLQCVCAVAVCAVATCICTNTTTSGGTSGGVLKLSHRTRILPMGFTISTK